MAKIKPLSGTQLQAADDDARADSDPVQVQIAAAIIGMAVLAGNCLQAYARVF